MNALDMIAAARVAQPAIPQNEGLILAARVASARVREAMADSPDRQVLFMIVGLSKKLTCAVARQICQDLPGLTVAVHEDMADDLLPLAMISRRSIADYRNSPREPGSGAIVFAPSSRELDDVGKTSGDIQQVSEQVLVAMPELWLDCSPHLASLGPRDRQNIVNVLCGIAEAQILTTGLEMFGEFVWRLDQAYASIEIERALDSALPALRIPHGAGRFKKLGLRGRLPSVQTWAERFRELQSMADDALNLRREGSPLNRAALRLRLRELADEAAVTEKERDVLSALVDDGRIEPGMWQPTQTAASELRWVAVERLVKTSKRKLQQPLGEATMALFRDKMPNALDDEDPPILEAMATDADSADDEERAFFFRQRTNIAEGSKSLLKRWEQYVFRKTEQHSDLALGLFIAIADLVEGTEVQPGKPLVYVRLQGADRRKFWDSHNPDLCRFMRDRYRGLPDIFLRVGVELDWGMCWTGDWDGGDVASRGSKTAREFKFDILLLDADNAGDAAAEGDPASGPVDRKKWLAEIAKMPLSTTQMIWSMPADSIASSYTDNMLVVANFGDEQALLASGRFSRAQDQDRSTDGRLSLERRTTFQDANGRPDGELVDPNDGRIRVGAAFERGLAELQGEILSEADAKAIEAAYRVFASSYRDAVRAMVAKNGKGLDDPALLRQSIAYGDLLDLLRIRARKDDCRRALWQPILSLGIAFSEDRPPVAICTPWHPFKLAASAAKARQLSEALSLVLSGGTSDVRTFSRTVARTIGDGWHPAVGLSPATPKPLLLSETDQFADFGLMEAPTLDQGAADAFDGYSDQAARELLGVSDEYLDIQPHERSNFSVVLYNADNRGLPSYLASALATKVEREKDLRCDLILTHSDQRRLRQIYTEQNVAISAKLDETLATEAAQTFLSRLRVGFIDLGGLGQADQVVQAADLVFLHDVIARGARTAWRRVPEPPNGWMPFEKGSPDGETRRRHFEKGTRKTESLLVPAERPLEVQRYLDLMRDFHLDFRDAPDGHYVPVREIDFDESGVGTILDQAHRVARWVVTYDAIADLHLFRSNNVNIIRYVPRPDRDHNLIVSTRHPGAMLLAKLSEEVGRVLDVGGKEAEALAKICINEASAISGRVVLRAARLENNALELLGLVLTRRVFLDSLDPGAVPVCWLLLDDFADRLGHKGRKADIIIVSLSTPDDVPTVDLAVVESKFVGLAGESAAMDDSMDQMRASTTDLRDRIIGSGDMLNRPTWLRRLADLLLEQGSFPGSVGGRDAQDWARLIRSDEASLRIVGLSMVFVHDRYDGAAEPRASQVPEMHQFVFNRDQVAESLRRIQSAGTGQH